MFPLIHADKIFPQLPFAVKQTTIEALRYPIDVVFAEHLPIHYTQDVTCYKAKAL